MAMDYDEMPEVCAVTFLVDSAIVIVVCSVAAVVTAMGKDAIDG